MKNKPSKNSKQRPISQEEARDLSTVPHKSPKTDNDIIHDKDLIKNVIKT